MPVLGITGGIATGKSSFVKALRQHLPAEVFDADATAHELLARDETIRQAVRARFGPEMFRPDGTPDRERLRELVFHTPAARVALEGILHPVIRARWIEQATQRRGEPGWLLVDIPLLYETEAEPHFDRVAVVACTPATQRARLRLHRGLEDAMIEKIIAAQHDLGVKIAKADHVIWNDSTVSCLNGQAHLFAGWLRKYYV